MSKKTIKLGVDLEGYSFPWDDLLSKVEKGERVEREDILALIESDEPIIDEAKPLLASIIEGAYKFPKGSKPNPKLPKKYEVRYFLFNLDFYEEQLEKVKQGGEVEAHFIEYFNGFKDESGLGLADAMVGKATWGRLTPREAVERMAAQMCNCTERTIQDIRTQENKRRAINLCAFFEKEFEKLNHENSREAAEKTTAEKLQFSLNLVKKYYSEVKDR